MRRIVVLGSTGSIGINCLDVVARFPNEFSVLGLTAYQNIDLLERQIRKFSPEFVAVKEDYVEELKSRVNGKVNVLDTNEGIKKMVSHSSTDIVVLSITGAVALKPLLDAIKHKKSIALANKEALVMAGRFIMNLANKYKVKIIPIDSEQSAIFQCLAGRHKKELRKIYLTASGGPLQSIPKGKLNEISKVDVLRHPRWNMGKKISVDSATLMNKGLEVIEASYLFDIDVDDIEVVIHKEAIIHSMVEFIDGTILAQMGITDMRLPIQYALSYPDRWHGTLSKLDFFKIRQLTFEKPDLIKFPCLKLAYRVAKQGGSAPCVLNASNEEAVYAFLNNRLAFNEIYPILKNVISKHKILKDPNLEDIIAFDHWARQETKKLIK